MNSHALDYTGALEALLQDHSRTESASSRAEQAPAVASARPIAIRDVEAQLALCSKILAGSPVFARIPALILALQDGHTGTLDTWMKGIFARLDGSGALVQLAGDCDPHERGKLLAVLALGMLAGFEHGAQRMTGAISNLRKVVTDAKLA